MYILLIQEQILDGILFFLGKYGYQIISFEPSQLNTYILKKNYCLNKDVKTTIINKGLYKEDKKCDLYTPNGNEEGKTIILITHDNEVI